MIDEPTRRLDEGALRVLVPRVLAGLVRRGEEEERSLVLFGHGPPLRDTRMLLDFVAALPA